MPISTTFSFFLLLLLLHHHLLHLHFWGRLVRVSALEGAHVFFLSFIGGTGT